MVARAVPALLAAGLILGAHGVQAASAVSPAVAVDTRAGVGVVLLWIDGGQSISSGASREYHCRALFSDSQDLDVTAATTWNVKATVLPPGTGFSGNSLHAGFVQSRQYITVTATYTHPGSGETKTASLTVAIEPVFSVSFTEETHYHNTTYWTVDLTAESSGPNGAATAYAWDLDGDGIFGDKTGAEVSKLFNAGRSFLVGVKATDSQGEVAIAFHYITTPTGNWAFWADKPVLAVDVVAGAFRDVRGAPYVPNAGRANVGLIIITHGLRDSTGDQDSMNNWVQLMGRAIVDRFGAATPNVCLFDWREMANPSLFDRGKSGDFWHNILNIKPYALAEGRILATWVNNQITLGNIRSDRPIHLIGHSAGGFVMGECGTRVGRAITQVTMLDTPDPAKLHFTAYPTVGLVERYVSSLYGKLCTEFVTDDDVYVLGDSPGYYASPFAAIFPPVGPRIDMSLHYYRGVIIPTEDLEISDDQHANAHEWYRTATIEGTEDNGFFYSPFMNNGFHGASAAQLAAESGTARVALEAVVTEEPITGFASFGTVSETNGLYILTEAEDVGLAKQMTMPLGAQALRFRFQFTSPGDGDFLAVYWGTNNPVLYIGLDLDLSRDAFLEAEVPVDRFAGESNQLAFVLTSRGETNAVLALDQIRLSLSDDPDNDGVTTTDEQTAGTNPLRYDTDGDGVSDGDEVNLHRTNPLRADTDGDGQADGQELLAGTDPTNSVSRFAITALTVQTNATLAIQWSGGTDRFYRVNSAASLGGDTFRTLVNNVAEHQVTVAETNDANFFWIELDDVAGR